MGTWKHKWYANIHIFKCDIKMVIEKWSSKERRQLIKERAKNIMYNWFVTCLELYLNKRTALNQ
jgi:hypothetical protein